jgi:FLVCR family feline leukemia virus subgroup C receptor-related protein
MLSFTLTIGVGSIWIVFVNACLLGFFMTGYLPIGFEFAAELTFPIAEGTTSGLLNGSAQVFGVGMTIGMGKVMYALSTFWCNILMTAFLFVGIILTALIKADLRRQNAHKDVQYTRSETQITATE